MPQKKSGSSNISSNQTLTDAKCPSKTDNQIGDQSRGRGIRKRRKGGHVNSIVSIRSRNGAGKAQNTNRPESHTVDNRFEDVPKTKVEMIRTTSKGPFLGTSRFEFHSMRSESSRSRNASSNTVTKDGSGHPEMDKREGKLRMMRERSTDGLETQIVQPLSTENTSRSTWDISTPEGSGQSLSEVGTHHESETGK